MRKRSSPWIRIRMARTVLRVGSFGSFNDGDVCRKSEFFDPKRIPGLCAATAGMKNSVQRMNMLARSGRNVKRRRRHERVIPTHPSPQCLELQQAQSHLFELQLVEGWLRVLDPKTPYPAPL